MDCFLNVKRLRRRNFYKFQKKAILEENLYLYFPPMYPWLKVASLGMVSFLSMYFYYIFYPWYGEDTSYLIHFLILNTFLYLSYKFFFFLFPREKTQVTSWNILFFFLVELFFLCLCFFWFQQASIGLWIFVFFKISFLLFCIAILWAIIFAFGKTLVKKLHIFEHDESLISWLTALWMGFWVFWLGMFLLGYFSLYTLPVVALYIILLAVLSYKKCIKLFTSFSEPIAEYEHNLDVKVSLSQKINISQIIDEFHLGVITFLLSINFISAYRPFPIGWDDLGVYMNYPRLLAQSWELLALGKMYFWELYTGIGFLTGTQVVAFYLNSFSGVIAALVVYFSVRYLLWDQKTKFSIPLFMVMILLALPMTVFQLAKDMKLDYGLLSITVIALTLSFHLVTSQIEKTRKQKVILFWILGFLIGIAFSIKFTALLLLLWIFAVIFYAHLSLAGFFGFLSLFVGIFTLGGFWSLMNVIVPEVSQSQKMVFSLFCLIWAGVFFILWSIFQKHSKKHFKEILLDVSMILVWFVLAIIPWGVKHIWELDSFENFSLSTILVGKADQYIADYSLIYTPEELQQKEEALDLYTESGKVTNEDFGRYFWYEPGINNYLKLPWNLTFQVNQKGEFTDITFIFFALIPLIFLFLPFKKQVYILPVIFIEIFLLAYFIPSQISEILSWIFSLINLPEWYFFIALFFIVPFVYLYCTLDRSQKISKLFLLNFAFATLYVFLWSISSFGIVWYGITMYFSFLLMIALSLQSAHNTDEDTAYSSLFLSLVVVWVYILVSVFPHGVTNLRTAGYPEYKLWKLSQEFSLMTLHQDYFSLLHAMNIQEDKKEELFQMYKMQLLDAVKDLPNAQDFVATFQLISTLPQMDSLLRDLSRYDIDPQVNASFQKIQQDMYEEVMQTSKDLRSETIIYRVGTFLKYFISENHKRVLEDSLITAFDTYIYDEDPTITKERFKKLDISYMLIDLNAATIDQDPAQNLTKRYENLLTFLAKSQAKLIESDSVCLKLWLDRYKEHQDINAFLQIATVNHGTRELKQQKYAACVGEIARLISEKKVSKDTYPYLMVYQNALPQLWVQETDVTGMMNAIAPYVSQWYKALFQVQ